MGGSQNPFAAIVSLGHKTVFGCIVAYHGAIVDIPTGWALCDGNNGTPDLRDSFVVGAGGVYPVGNTGGNPTHTHAFTTDGHTHQANAYPPNIISSAAPDSHLTTEVDTGTTDPTSNLPPYYALAYIMHL